MKRFLALPIFLLVVTYNSHAQVLVDSLSLESYGSNANFYGLDGSDGLLYLGKDFDGQIISIDTDGNEVASYATPYDFCHGLALTDNGFYTVEDYTSSGAGLYEVDFDGNEVQAYVLPEGILGPAGGVGGLDKVGDAVWFTVYYQDSDDFPYAYAYLWVPGTEGYLDTVPMNGGQPHGIEQVGDLLFYVMDDNDDDLERLYVYDLIEETDIGYVDLPDTQNDNDQSPRGLHYDGEFLWLMADRAGGSAFAFNMLYKYDIQGLIATSIEEIDPTMDFTLAPNPVRDEVQIITQADLSEISRIEILDARGRTVTTYRPSKQVDVTDLSKGAYLLRIWRGSQSSSHRFFKQ